MFGLTIEVYEHEEGYTVIAKGVDGEVTLEFESEEEASELTLGEITMAMLK